MPTLATAIASVRIANADARLAPRQVRQRLLDERRHDDAASLAHDDAVADRRRSARRARPARGRASRRAPSCPRRSGGGAARTSRRPCACRGCRSARRRRSASGRPRASARSPRAAARRRRAPTAGGRPCRRGRRARGSRRAIAPRSRREPRRAKSSGSVAFSSAVSVGSSWKNWKTIPTLAPRQTASCSSLRSSRRRPSTVTVPAVGRSMPVIMFSSVDLPLPDGPTIATIWPSSIARSTPRSAGYSSFPVRKTFSTPASSISGARRDEGTRDDGSGGRGHGRIVARRRLRVIGRKPESACAFLRSPRR